MHRRRTKTGQELVDIVGEALDFCGMLNLAVDTPTIRNSFPFALRPLTQKNPKSPIRGAHTHVHLLVEILRVIDDSRATRKDTYSTASQIEFNMGSLYKARPYHANMEQRTQYARDWFLAPHALFESAVSAGQAWRRSNGAYEIGREQLPFRYIALDQFYSGIAEAKPPFSKNISSTNRARLRR